MRPLRLTMEGFRSHRERSEFDFSERGLVGVVGPTGSGKSSILDALAFALYGRTPSVGKAVSKLVNGRSDVAQVELWFTVGDDCLRIARRLGKTSAQSLERWNEVDGTKLETITDKAAEINAWVTEATGLGYESFSRSILLAQNQFMAMLTATPSDGARVLTGLFGFGVIEEMRKRTKELLDGVKAELAAAKEAESAHTAKVEALAVAESAVAVAEERLERLASLEAPLKELADQLQATMSRLVEAKERADRLGRSASALPNDAVLGKTIRDALDHERLLAAAVDAEQEATAQLERASAAVDDAMVDDLPGAIGALEAAIATATGAEGQLAAASESERAAIDHATKAAESLAAITQREADARTARAEAEEAAVAASEALAGAEARHAAHVLSEGLGVGDACPVCDRELTEVPSVPAGDDFEAIRETARLTAERSDSAGASLSAEAMAMAVAESAAARATADLGKQRAAVAAATSVAEEARATVDAALSALGSDGDPAEALDSAKQRWRELGAAKNKAAENHARATEARRGLESTDVMAGFHELVAEHARAASTVGIEAAIAAEPSKAEAALIAVRKEIGQQLDDTTAAVAAAESEAREIETDRAERLAAADVDDVAAFELAFAAAKDALAGAKARAGLLADQVAEGASALERAAAASARALSLERLHADLAPGKFPQFLLDEKRQELTAVASEWFRDLSRGRYEFAWDSAKNQFRVRHLSAAGLVLDIDTLSGGETFLASLSLALGLATMVGMEGGSLEAFFIDEGFGSLDAESLDLAMDGMEQLVGDDGRLVVVVSHVPELRERIEDLIVLGKEAVTGETVVVRS